jgi:hypothetical protein
LPFELVIAETNVCLVASLSGWFSDGVHAGWLFPGTQYEVAALVQFPSDADVDWSQFETVMHLGPKFFWRFHVLHTVDCMLNQSGTALRTKASFC